MTYKEKYIKENLDGDESAFTDATYHIDCPFELGSYKSIVMCKHFDDCKNCWNSEIGTYERIKKENDSIKEIEIKNKEDMKDTVYTKKQKLKKVLEI